MELNREGKTIVIVTHDISITKRLKRIIEIGMGKYLRRKSHFYKRRAIAMRTPRFIKARCSFAMD